MMLQRRADAGEQLQKEQLQKLSKLGEVVGKLRELELQLPCDSDVPDQHEVDLGDLQECMSVLQQQMCSAAVHGRRSAEQL